MKLTLTIQEVTDRETLARFKAVFGTLEVTLPDAKGKNKKERINFVSNTKEVKGLDPIVEGLITSALALRKQNKEDKTVTTGDIQIPNRTTRRKNQ